MTRQRLARLIAVARGDRPADLVFKGGRVVNVLSRTIQQRDLAVADGFIVGLGDYKAKKVIDVSGRYLAPGFIEGHLHIESSLLTPPALARAVLPHGTTAVIADPHEIANVHGKAGLEYMFAAAEGLPVDVRYVLPSCVPATSLETAGATLSAADLAPLRDHPRVAGLGEMMNFPGVVAGQADVLDKLVAFWGGHLDGHAPGLGGKDLNAYLLAGPRTDHECVGLPEAAEKLDAGMWVLIREGTLARNLADLLPLVNPAAAPRCLLVSDDLHPDVILDSGHLDRIARRAVELGLDPVVALEMITTNPARCFGLDRRGALAPGYIADVVVLSDLEAVIVEAVYVAGRLAARQGKAVGFPRSEAAYGLTSMNLPPVTAERFVIPAQGSRARVIGVVQDQVLTEALVKTVRIEDGVVVSDPEADVLKLAVVERYTGRAGLGLGLVSGFQLKSGALASSVAHDSHNVIAVGVTDEDLALAVGTVAGMGGGLCTVAGGRVAARLPLPVAGLMSERPIAQVRQGLAAVRRAAADLGCPIANPFMALSFLALPVIPSLKLTDQGLVDVDRFQRVSLFSRGRDRSLKSGPRSGQSQNT